MYISRRSSKVMIDQALVSLSGYALVTGEKRNGVAIRVHRHGCDMCTSVVFQRLGDEQHSVTCSLERSRQMRGMCIFLICPHVLYGTFSRILGGDLLIDTIARWETLW